MYERMSVRACGLMHRDGPQGLGRYLHTWKTPTGSPPTISLVFCSASPDLEWRTVALSNPAVVKLDSSHQDNIPCPTGPQLMAPQELQQKPRIWKLPLGSSPRTTQSSHVLRGSPGSQFLLLPKLTHYTAQALGPPKLESHGTAFRTLEPSHGSTNSASPIHNFWRTLTGGRWLLTS